MMLAEALVTFQWGWPHMHHLFALLCLVAVVYKLIIAFGKRRDVIRNFEFLTCNMCTIKVQCVTVLIVILVFKV